MSNFIIRFNKICLSEDEQKRTNKVTPRYRCFQRYIGMAASCRVTWSGERSRTPIGSMYDIFTWLLVDLYGKCR